MLLEGDKSSIKDMNDSKPRTNEFVRRVSLRVVPPRQFATKQVPPGFEPRSQESEP